MCDNFDVVLISHQYFHFQIGPIPIDDGVGKEIVTKISSTLMSNKKFYTDSNGRDFIERVCCHQLVSKADIALLSCSIS